jgi:hypothetical protein
MRFSLLFAPIGLLCLALPAAGQHVRGGLMAGPSWPGAESGTGYEALDTGFGVEGWIGVELLALPILPRAAFALDHFSGDQQRRLDLKSARIDVLGSLRDVPLEPFGFAGVGIASTSYTSTSSEPVGIVDPGVMFGGGIGARQALGPIRITAEARYFIVPDADLNVMQFRLGIGF